MQAIQKKNYYRKSYKLMFFKRQTRIGLSHFLLRPEKFVQPGDDSDLVESPGWSRVPGNRTFQYFPILVRTVIKLPRGEFILRYRRSTLSTSFIFSAVPTTSFVYFQFLLLLV